MGRIAKGNGNLAKAVLGVKPSLGGLGARLRQVVADRGPAAGPEGPAELARGQSAQRSQFRGRGVDLARVSDAFVHEPQTPGCPPARGICCTRRRKMPGQLNRQLSNNRIAEFGAAAGWPLQFLVQAQHERLDRIVGYVQRRFQSALGPHIVVRKPAFESLRLQLANQRDMTSTCASQLEALARRKGNQRSQLYLACCNPVIAEAPVGIGSPRRKAKVDPVDPLAAEGVSVRPIVVKACQDHMRLGQLHFSVDLEAALLPAGGSRFPAISCRGGL